jgi:hypothetical protein
MPNRIAFSLLAVLFFLFVTFCCFTGTPQLSAAETGKKAGAPIGKQTSSTLTLDQLKNTEYLVLDDTRVKLTNGKYESPPSSGDFLRVFFDRAVFGDLNNDGALDAAVIVVTSGGGSGVFYSLEAVLNENGQPKYVASADLGDRIKINALSIKSGMIVVDMTNPRAVKEFRRQVVKYGLESGKLVEK